MGLFDFLRRKDEKAMPDSGTAEFQGMVEGSTLPGSELPGGADASWSSVGDATSAEELGRQVAARMGLDPDSVEVDQSSTQTVDLRGTDAREEIIEALRQHGIDPDQKGQEIDASNVPGLQEAIFKALGDAGVQIPGMTDAASAKTLEGGMRVSSTADPVAQIEHLAAKKQSGEITEAEFEAQKRQILGES